MHICALSLTSRTGQMKEIVQNLYNLIAQTYDHAGAATVSAMEREVFVFPYTSSAHHATDASVAHL